MAQIKERKFVCDICGAAVQPPDEEVLVSGWYGGCQYDWDDDGQLNLTRAYCAKHPYDIEQEAREMDAARSLSRKYAAEQKRTA